MTSFKSSAVSHLVVLTFGSVALALVVACARPAVGVSEPTGSHVAPLTEEALKGATYRSEWEASGTITLTDGRCDGEPFVEGGATHLVVTLVGPVAFGDLDCDGVDDAVVILVADPAAASPRWKPCASRAAAPPTPRRWR